jgi:hypothetical protein
MWIFTNDAFVSIVAVRDDPDKLLVRARFKRDLTNLLPGARVRTTPDGDYRFRAVVSRDVVLGFIADRIEAIDYPNFKDSVPERDRARHDAYLRVWGVMHAAQRDALPRRRSRRRRTSPNGDAARHPRFEDSLIG